MEQTSIGKQFVMIRNGLRLLSCHLCGLRLILYLRCVLQHLAPEVIGNRLSYIKVLLLLGEFYGCG